MSEPPEQEHFNTRRARLKREAWERWEEEESLKFHSYSQWRRPPVPGVWRPLKKRRKIIGWIKTEVLSK